VHVVFSFLELISFHRVQVYTVLPCYTLRLYFLRCSFSALALLITVCCLLSSFVLRCSAYSSTVYLLGTVTFVLPIHSLHSVFCSLPLLPLFCLTVQILYIRSIAACSIYTISRSCRLLCRYLSLLRYTGALLFDFVLRLRFVA
jgi:hypothetical protein